MTPAATGETPGSEPRDADPPHQRGAWTTTSISVFLAVLGLAWATTAAGQGQAEPPEHHAGRDLLLVLGLVLLNGLFAMAEAALLSVRRSRIDQLVDEGHARARLASELLRNPTRLLSTLQVGVTLVALFSAGVAAENLVDPFSAWIRSVAGSGFLYVHARSIAFLLTILSVSLVSLVLGEIMPKSIAIHHAERVALWTVYPIRWLQFATTPVVAFVTKASSLLTRPFGVSAEFHPTALGEDELRLLVEQSEEHGVIDSDEKEMIHSIFDFGETRVREVMTPRLDVVAIPVSATVAELSRVVRESGHSRLPVFDGDLDHIVGVVHIKDALPALGNGQGDCPVQSIMHPPYLIPQSKLVADLLTELRRARTKLALVRDEYGTLTGVVTLEDLVEEIVGEIRDEFEPPEDDEVLWAAIDERTFLASGRISLDEFNDRMGTALTGGDADTLGGYVFSLLGHQPVQGESADAGGLVFQVAATDGRRILKLNVRRRSEGQVESGIGP